MRHPPQVVFVLGLGYVGLPLAVLFAERLSVIGYDRSAERRQQLRSGLDVRRAVSAAQLAAARRLDITDDPSRIGEADVVICCIPTPVDAQAKPDLELLREAMALVGRYLRSGSSVVIESTVFPGATEEICVPILEKISGLSWKSDFFVAYSPERVNPGDEAHGLRQVVKVVAGDTPETLQRMSELYELVVDAGIYRAPSIRVAEAAKLVENVQRDVNIALMNELSAVLYALELDTHEVLSAARTKWNFLPFWPGLVGGHCVAVDPYYLIEAARSSGETPELLSCAREVNERFPARLFERIRGSLALATGARVLVLGVTFKRDCADLRNSKVPALVELFRRAGGEVECVDGFAPEGEAVELGLPLVGEGSLSGAFDVMVLAVDHQIFRADPERWLDRVRSGGAVVDLPGLFDAPEVRRRGLRLVRL